MATTIILGLIESLGKIGLQLLTAKDETLDEHILRLQKVLADAQLGLAGLKAKQDARQAVLDSAVPKPLP